TLLAGGDGLEVGAGAEGASGAGQDGDARAVVVIVVLEGVEKRLSGRRIHGVAHLWAVDGHDEDIALAVDQDALAHLHAGCARPPSHSFILRVRVPRFTSSRLAAAVTLPPVDSRTRRMWRRSMSASEREASSVGRLGRRA